MDNRFISAFVDEAVRFANEHDKELEAYKSRLNYELVKCDICDIYGLYTKTCALCNKKRTSNCATIVMNRVYGDVIWTDELYNSIANSPNCAHCCVKD
jgi:hypothetical protein